MRQAFETMNSSELDDFVKQLPKLTWKQVMILNAVVWRYHRLWRTKEQHAKEDNLCGTLACPQALAWPQTYGLCLNLTRELGDQTADDNTEILSAWPRSANYVDNVGDDDTPALDFYIIPSDDVDMDAPQRYRRAYADSSMLVGTYGADRIDLLKFFVKKRVRHSGFLKRLFLTASIFTASKDYKIG